MKRNKVIVLHEIEPGNQMSKDVFIEAVETVVGQMPGEARAFDPTTIRVWADLFFELLDRCRERRGTDRVVEDLQLWNRRTRIAYKRGLREDMPRDEWRANGRDLMEGTRRALDTASKSDIRKLVEATAS